MKGIRRRLGYTQEGMAEAMGISPSYYVVLERGRRRISDDLGMRALRVHREPTAWSWFEAGHAVGRDLAGGVPQEYDRRVRPTAMHLAAGHAFQQWLRRQHGTPITGEAQEAFQQGFEAGWAETQARGAKEDERG